MWRVERRRRDGHATSLLLPHAQVMADVPEEQLGPRQRPEWPTVVPGTTNAVYQPNVPLPPRDVDVQKCDYPPGEPGTQVWIYCGAKNCQSVGQDKFQETHLLKQSQATPGRPFHTRCAACTKDAYFNNAITALNSLYSDGNAAGLYSVGEEVINRLRSLNVHCEFILL